MRFPYLAAVLLCVFVSIAGVADAAELKAGSDLPPFFKKLQQGKPVTVAAIGGSITQAHPGWFSFVVDGLREQFPAAKIRAVNAGLSGTGSDLGVFRLDRDVISSRPDLVFIEFAVNDGDADQSIITRNLESIVVRLKQMNPAPAIVFVQSASRDETFRTPHQRVARHYGLLDVDLQAAVDAHLEATKGKWESLFADDVHPHREGHLFYAATVLRVLHAASQQQGRQATTLPSPISSAPLILDAAVQPLNVEATGWHRLPDCSLEATTPAVLQFPVWGDVIGLDRVSSEASEVRISVDGQSRSEAAGRWIYGWRTLEPPLTSGWHVVTIAAPAAPDGKRAKVRVGALLARQQNDHPLPAPDWWDAARQRGPYTPDALLFFRWQEIAPSAWQVIGPFGGEAPEPWLEPARDLERAFGVRFEAPPASLPQTSTNGPQLSWRSGQGSNAWNSRSWVDLAKMYGVSDRGVSFARLTLHSPREQQVLAGLRLDYFGILSVNGRQVLNVTQGHGWPGFRLQFLLPLQKGANEIWLKVHAGSKGSGFGLDVDSSADLTYQPVAHAAGS